MSEKDTVVLFDALKQELVRVPVDAIEKADWAGKDWREGAAYVVGRSEEQAEQYIRDMPGMVRRILQAAVNETL